MAELTTPEGAPVDVVDREVVNQQFAAALASDGPDEAQAPPKREAPAGGPPKRPRGRPRKNPDDKPRVTDKPAEAPAARTEKDFTDECAGLSTLGWAALAAIPWTSPYAAIIELNQESLVKALNAGCQQNPKIREAVERWSSGAGGVYMLQLAAVGTNMGAQAIQLLKDPRLRAEARAHTEGKFRDFLRAQGVNLPGTAESDATVADLPPQTEAPDAPVAA